MARKALLQGVFAVGVAGAVLLSGACGMVTEQFADNEAVGQTIRSVLVANDSGAVKIRTGGTTRVHRQVHHNADRPGATHRVDGDVLILQSCPVRNCWVDYDVVVPEGVTVSGKIDSGDVEVEGAGSVNLSAGSGDVTVRKVAGKVTVAADSGRVDLVDIGDNVSVEVSSGSVKAVGLGGSADIAASSGSVEVALVEVGDVRARANSGSVQVVVPRGRYRVNAVVDSGDLDNAIGSDVAAANAVDVAADSGDVSIRFG
ncbi:DUF4097 family beta strand repeat-containing protein [Actinokineospora xionganensis]|uniref:DUF4097 family beta strand repeat protein n=1 Tax=Actinokineospora xionganensis TaxID=2684470 RepID=A0ABR7L9L0_9PSEU|nr:DUF4097 family beta strand repeat-containing protein [Actinokineospora xionganensis]MBC6449076.1 DUF4097 family beta strand repeat protein [Actinokineospora xionganensis]